MSKTTKKKNSMKNFMPMFQGMMPMMPTMPVMPVMPMMPPMPFMWNNTSYDDAWDDFKSNMDKFYEQVMDMQQTTMDNAKDQWNKFFEYMMDMQDTFADNLPDEVPTLPGLPQMPVISPKEFMKQTKEFQEMANKQFVEQADSVAEFSRKSQKKAREVVDKAIDNAKEEKEEKEEPAKEEASAK